MARVLSKTLIILSSVSFISSCGYFKVESSFVNQSSVSPLSSKKGVQISSVSSAAADGIYKEGDTINISVEFTKPVEVSAGTPFLKLNTSATAMAVYLSGSSSNILVFRYTVNAGENNKNLNYSSAVLNLDTAVIRGVENSDEVSLDLPAIGNGGDLSAAKNIEIDTTPPVAPTNLEDSSWSNKSAQSPVFTFTEGSDNQSSIITYKAKIVDNTDSVDVTSFATIISGGSISGLNLLNGHNYSFVIKAIDLAGNESAPLASNGWTVDTIRPSQPGVITIGAVPANFRQSTPVFTFANSTDALSGITYYEIEIRKSSDSSIVKPYTQVTGNGVNGLVYSETIDFLNSGESFFVNIRAMDEAGNAGIVRVSATSWVALQCPNNYTAVPPRMPYSSQGFCIAKFEMKIQGNDVGEAVYSTAFAPESRPTGTPWVNLNRAQSITECQSLGIGYSLISNAQWQTVAQNVELVPSNWTSGVVGSELMYEGHSDNVPPRGLEIDNIANRYYLTGNNNTQAADVGKNQKRALILSTGVEIWDFAGNVEEWISDSINTNFATDNFWSLITDATAPAIGLVGGLTGTAKFLFGPQGSYSNLQTVTFNYGGLGSATINANPAMGPSAAVRGGRWLGDNIVGAFRISQMNPTFSANYTGFRCIYDPFKN